MSLRLQPGTIPCLLLRHPMPNTRESPCPGVQPPMATVISRVNTTKTMKTFSPRGSQPWRPKLKRKCSILRIETATNYPPAVHEAPPWKSQVFTRKKTTVHPSTLRTWHDVGRTTIKLTYHSDTMSDPLSWHAFTSPPHQTATSALPFPRLRQRAK